MDREVTYIEAVRETFRAAMAKDETVFIIGEDVKIGIFATTRGLYEEFGPQRVLNSPIWENAIVGAAIGAAMSGMRPVAQIMFADFVYLAMDEVANQLVNGITSREGNHSRALLRRPEPAVELRPSGP